MLQNLGRLVVRYHFPDEAEQIARLMRTVASTDADEPEEAGMSEASASYAVLGVDLASIAHAVGRHWGFEHEVVHMFDRVCRENAIEHPLTRPMDKRYLPWIG